MASGTKGWSRKFDDPIVLPDGRKIKTLRQAMEWLAKEIPKSEHGMTEVQAAVHCITAAAEKNSPIIFAHMGILQAANRHNPRVFSDRKESHWGKRKLKRDE